MEAREAVKTWLSVADYPEVLKDEVATEREGVEEEFANLHRRR